MAERVYYRNEEEFKAAFDKAVEAIDNTRRVGRIDAVIWFGLWGVLVVLYLGWIFGWRLHAVVPGVDLRSVTWILLIGYFVLYHIRARHKHTFILRARQCLACGEKLLKVETNDAGDGTCPACGREFNLGEYRRPAERRGAQFQGYLDADHFDKAMHEAGERVMKRRGLGVERDVMGGMWIALGIAFGFDVLLDVNIFASVPGENIWLWGCLAAMLVWSGIYTSRVKGIVPSLVPERRCLECGYSLLGTPVGNDGVGRCPECASTFTAAEYERPAEDDGEDEGSSA
jgi:predicted Zn-ribbon and HTH transcriptional regulator